MKIRITVAALAFGVAFAAVPAFAQTHYGRNLNDGGLVDVTAAPSSKPIYNTAAPATPHIGRPANDGGTIDVTGSAPKNIQWVQNPPHFGRPLNDGGF